MLKKLKLQYASVIKDIGYEQTGFDWRTVEITNLLHGQSADIALGTDNFGAGDQGLMFGYACNETPNYMPSNLLQSQDCGTLGIVRKNGHYLGLAQTPRAKSHLNTTTMALPNVLPKLCAQHNTVRHVH
jgi:S-adenosylmethionine synthetase